MRPAAGKPDAVITPTRYAAARGHHAAVQAPAPYRPSVPPTPRLTAEAI
jgi:hypothetical protein